MIAYAALVLTVAWFAGLGGYWLAKRRQHALRDQNAALCRHNQELEQCRRGLIQDVAHYKAREQTLEAQLRVAVGEWAYAWRAG